MWIFLASEVLFFGALFCAYAVYRSFNVEAFRIAGAHTEIVYGSINTVLLLTSSLTMTVALRAATVQLRELTLFCLAVTAALGVAFLVCKGLEYRDDLKEHLFPGPHFPLSPPATQMFWGFYWIMTGIHAVHLSAGIGSCFGRVHVIQAAHHSGARLDHGRRGDLLALRRFGLARALFPALSGGPPMSDPAIRPHSGGYGKVRASYGLGRADRSFAVTLGSAYLPLGTANVAINLAIAAAMVAVLAHLSYGFAELNSPRSYHRRRGRALDHHHVFPDFRRLFFAVLLTAAWGSVEKSHCWQDFSGRWEAP